MRDTPLHRCACFLALLIPPAFLLGPAVADVLFCLIGVLFLVRCMQARDLAWRHQRWVQPALMLGLYVAVRDLWLPDGGQQALLALGWLRLPLGALALACWVLPDARTEKWMVRGLGFVLLVLIADSAWQFIHGTDLLGHGIVISDGFPRLTGPYAGPRVGITLVWLLFPVAGVLLGGSALPSPLRRGIGCLLLVSACLVVYVSGERMALGLFALGLSVLFVLLPQARRTVLLAVAIAVASVHFMNQANETLSARQLGTTRHTVGGFGDSVYGRTWYSALQIAATHPLFGAGTHQFQPECSKPDYGPVSPEALRLRCPMHPHNHYLAWLTESGVVGLSLMLAIIGCWSARVWQRRALWRHDALSIGLLAAMAVRLWPLSVTPNHMAGWVLLPMWFFVGWLLARLRIDHSPQSDA